VGSEVGSVTAITPGLMCRYAAPNKRKAQEGFIPGRFRSCCHHGHANQ
jgi:hypothetical protein